MARYSAALLQATTTTTFKSLGVLWNNATPTARASIYEFDLGQPGALNTSTDCQVQYDVSRITLTSAGAGAAVTPTSLDLADAATSFSFMNAISTEFTPIAAGTGLLQIPINQRGTFRWRALDDGDNILIPATTLLGITTRALSSAYTGTAMGSIHYSQ